MNVTDVASNSGVPESLPNEPLGDECSDEQQPQSSGSNLNSPAHAEEHDDNLMCRVCRGNDGHLYYPCLCTGSIKYVHQECLTEWLKYSKKEVCELCNYKYSFQAIYRPDMPKALPLKDILKGVALNGFRMMKTWLLYSIVMLAWLGIVPLTAARIYNAVFYSSMYDVLLIPGMFLRTDNIMPDIFKGSCLLTLFICTFISLVWLREQIIHGGPQDFLNIPNPPQVAPHNDNNQQNLEHHLHDIGDNNDGNAEEEDYDSDVDSSSDEDEVGVNEYMVDWQQQQQVFQQQEQQHPLALIERPAAPGPDAQRAAQEPMLDHQEPEADHADEAEHPEAEQDQEQPQEDNWRDWDRLGDELTWQRLLGLDGSFVFLEHVFWVISLNTLFTVLFAYSPYKLGHFLLSKLGVQQQIHHFPSLVAILFGYFAFSNIVYMAHALAGFLGFRSLFRMLGICFLVLKVFLLVLLEIGMFPIICGCWMDLCSLSLFSSTISSRIATFSASPTSAVFVHWMIGMVYVFYSASFVLLLREVVRPGVLWFMRNLNDPEFNPIQEMIELPVSRHLQRIVASTSLFFSTIFLVVYLPLRIVRKVVPSCLPYNMSLSADTPLSELSLELLILQVVLPALLEQTQARVLLKAAVRFWCQKVGKFLELDRYLLPEEDIDGNPAGAAPAPPPAAPAAAVAADMVGGGLAAEHQALLLIREPRAAAHPYVRPSWFAFRILALVACMAATWTLTSSLCFFLPVTLGRAIIRLTTGLTNVHDLYTVGAGLYVAWMTIRLVLFVIEWCQRGMVQMRETMVAYFKLVFRLLFVIIPVAVMVPILLGTYFQLVIVTPLRLEMNQSALFFPWQDWAMGVLHLKIVCAVIMMGPDWWLKQAFERMYQDGLRNLNCKRILLVVVLPVVLSLSSMLAVPYIIARIIIAVGGFDLEGATLVYRICYPSSLLILVTGAFMHWQYTKFKGLAENIRNEKYLVGTQLVNYERQKAVAVLPSTSALPDPLEDAPAAAAADN